MEKNISEVAKLFNIPVSTLHYWEQQGLFNVQRKENRYRTYEMSDILSIWEIILYREIGVPIKEIPRLLEQDASSMAKTYEENEQKIHNEMLQLQKKLEKLQHQKELLKLKERLEKEEMIVSQPDLNSCIKDPFEIDTIRRSLEDPYQCLLYFNHHKGSFERAICGRSDEKSALWKRKEEGKYLEVLLKVNIEAAWDSNIAEIKDKMKEKGYAAGDIIARYLLIASEQGKRYEYYRAWIEILGQ